MNPLSRITGEGRAEILRTWGPDFDQKGGGRGGGGGRDGWGSSISAWKLFYLVDCCRGMFRGTCSLRSVPWLNNDDTTYSRGTIIKGTKYVSNNWEMYRLLCVVGTIYCVPAKIQTASTREAFDCFSRSVPWQNNDDTV